MTESSVVDRRPPYVPFATFQNFLNDHKQGLPTRLDGKLLEHVGGSLRTQLFAALKFLDLIEDDKTVKDKLQKLVRADVPERKKLLAEVIRDSYSFLFNDNGFDLAHASDTDFRKQFEKIGVSGVVQRKAVTFFLLASDEAGIPLSRYIQRPTGRTASKGKSKRQVRRAAGKKATPERDSSALTQDNITGSPPDVNAATKALMDYFTSVNTWKKDQREQVFEVAEKLIALMRSR
jgi:hypothetical protein